MPVFDHSNVFHLKKIQILWNPSTEKGLEFTVRLISINKGSSVPCILYDRQTNIIKSVNKEFVKYFNLESSKVSLLTEYSESPINFEEIFYFKDENLTL
jgi:hypothetical protein